MRLNSHLGANYLQSLVNENIILFYYFNEYKIMSSIKHSCKVLWTNQPSTIRCCATTPHYAVPIDSPWPAHQPHNTRVIITTLHSHWPPTCWSAHKPAPYGRAPLKHAPLHASHAHDWCARALATRIRRFAACLTAHRSAWSLVPTTNSSKCARLNEKKTNNVLCLILNWLYLWCRCGLRVPVRCRWCCEAMWRLWQTLPSRMTIQWLLYVLIIVMIINIIIFID